MEDFNDDIAFFISYILKTLNRGDYGFKLGFIFNDEAIKYFKTIETLNTDDFNYLKSIKPDSNKVIVKVNDYKSFFKYLFLIAHMTYERLRKEIEFEELDSYYIHRCDVFKNIWLRATPNDFNDINKFIYEQYLFIKDNSLIKYDNKVVGKFFDYNILVDTLNGRTYDENCNALRIRLIKDDISYTLPVVRYDIKNETNKKICYIGAIQNKTVEESNKEINRLLYKLNKDVDKEYLENVYNGSLLSLIIFVNILMKENINTIKVPLLHTLSYDYHIKIGEMASKRYITLNCTYKNDCERYINKEDFISKAKTENLLSTFLRLNYHYPFMNIINDPFIEDDYLNINIKNDIKINSQLISDIYDSMNESYNDETDELRRKEEEKYQKYLKLFNIRTTI